MVQVLVPLSFLLETSTELPIPGVSSEDKEQWKLGETREQSSETTLAVSDTRQLAAVSEPQRTTTGNSVNISPEQEVGETTWHSYRQRHLAKNLADHTYQDCIQKPP